MQFQAQASGSSAFINTSNLHCGYPPFPICRGSDRIRPSGDITKMSNRLGISLALLIWVTAPLGSVAAQAQSESPVKDDNGFTSYLEFGGTSNSAGQVYELDSSVGYNFTQHFGMDFAVPVYFVNASSSVTGSTSGNGVGNPSVDLRWKYPHTAVSYATVLTGSAPLGNKNLGLNTGHATFDWSNRFDHGFNQVTPFFEAGFSNTTSDSRLFVRPYTTFGLNSHFRGGAEIDLWKFISVGAAGYDIAPFGNQTVFSRVVGKSGTGSGASHGRSFNAGHVTTGSASVATDNGFSMWVDASLNKYIDAELGYTRSVHYELNSVAFSLGLNVGHLLHANK